MIVDRVARAMTEGAPRAGFTARVMAPILGQPRPGFTARVMANLEAPEPRALATRLRPALAAVALLAIAATGALFWLPGASLPATPSAPYIAAWPYDRAAIDVPPLPFDRWAPRAGLTSRAPRASEVMLVHIDVTDAYRIAALPPAPPLELPSIGPAPASLAPLAAPAALTLSDIHIEKETP